MIKEKKEIEIAPSELCSLCRKKLESGELIYLIEGWHILCEKCGKEHKQIREKRIYAIKGLARVRT